MNVFVDILQNYRWIVGQFALKHRGLANWYHILLCNSSFVSRCCVGWRPLSQSWNDFFGWLCLRCPDLVVIWQKKNKSSPKSPSIGGTNYSQMGCLFCFNHITLFICALNGSPTRWAYRSHSLTVVHVAWLVRVGCFRRVNHSPAITEATDASVFAGTTNTFVMLRSQFMSTCFKTFIWLCSWLFNAPANILAKPYPLFPC